MHPFNFLLNLTCLLLFLFLFGIFHALFTTALFSHPKPENPFETAARETLDDIDS